MSRRALTIALRSFRSHESIEAVAVATTGQSCWALATLLASPGNAAAAAAAAAPGASISLLRRPAFSTGAGGGRGADGTPSTSGGGDGDGDEVVRMLDAMMSDPATQQLLLARLPAPMRRPEVVRAMLSDPAVRGRMVALARQTVREWIRIGAGWDRDGGWDLLRVPANSSRLRLDRSASTPKKHKQQPFPPSSWRWRASNLIHTATTTKQNKRASTSSSATSEGAASTPGR